ncbi:MAG: NFACT RNA binding domain-containing protein, partial [Oscillospiraceae bacterium]|nr:NFACT RNA binding domain-containing protein [Oscillospiraceae bacterium]
HGQDLMEIRKELLEAGILPSRGKSRKEKRNSPSKPMEFRSSAGLKILVGRNNMQNDQLTLKTAFKSDVWFHVQKMPGSHVILRCQGKEPDPISVNQAAELAAFFSSARGGQKVPVDYTLARHVKKPVGARPGMVVYDPYQTAFVTPRENLVLRLRV